MPDGEFQLLKISKGENHISAIQCFYCGYFQIPILSREEKNEKLTYNQLQRLLTNGQSYFT